MSNDITPIEVHEVREFLRQYTKIFRDLLDTKYSIDKQEFLLYDGTPFQIFAFIVPIGVLVTCKTNVSDFRIEVQKVKELPKERHSFTQFYTNHHFRKAMANPQMEAEREIVLQLNLEKALEEYEESQLEWYQQEWSKHVQSEVMNFCRYLSDADGVQKETLDKNAFALFHLIEQVARFQNRIEMFAMIDADSLILLYDQILDDMHTSIFLAAHGKYAQAMASVRRVLETYLRGIESDHWLATHTETRPSDMEKWLKSRDLNFSGEGGIVETLLDVSTDRIVTSFVKKFGEFECVSVQGFVKKQYSELSRYVHFEDSSQRQMALRFAEYDDRLFDEWRKTYAAVMLICDLILLLKFHSLLDLYSQGEKVGFPRLSVEEVRFLQDEIV